MTANAALRLRARHSATAAAGTEFPAGSSRAPGSYGLVGARPRIHRKPSATSRARQIGLAVAAIVGGIATISWCLWILLAFFAS